VTTSPMSTRAAVRALSLLAAGATASAGLSLAVADPARAASSSVPGCVTVTPTKGWVSQTVWVQNNCSSALSFRVISVGPQLGFRCFTVGARAKGGWRFPTSKKYLWTELCK